MPLVAGRECRCRCVLIRTGMKLDISSSRGYCRCSQTWENNTTHSLSVKGTLCQWTIKVLRCNKYVRKLVMWVCRESLVAYLNGKNFPTKSHWSGDRYLFYTIWRQDFYPPSRQAGIISAGVMLALPRWFTGTKTSLIEVDLKPAYYLRMTPAHLLIREKNAFSAGYGHCYNNQNISVKQYFNRPVVWADIWMNSVLELCDYANWKTIMKFSDQENDSHTCLSISKHGEPGEPNELGRPPGRTYDCRLGQLSR